MAEQKKNIGVIYLSIDGLTEPLGQSQILAYLKILSLKGIRFSIISFEKPDLFNLRGQEIKRIVNDYGLDWHPIVYRSNPPVIGIIFGLFQTWLLLKKLHRNNRANLIHSRGYITTILALIAKRRLKLPFIFDMRGWGADEKLESGHWAKWYYRPVYNYFKRKEVQFFNEADKVVSLTHVGKEEILKRKLANESNIGVIPTCVDFSVFKAFDIHVRASIREELNISEGAKVLLYSGSLGGNYPIKEILLFFKYFNESFPDSHFIILCKNLGVKVEEVIKELGIERSLITLKSVFIEDVNKYIMAADVGLIYYEKTFSAIGRSPTKLGEYWASGIPAISIEGVGDLNYISSKYPTNLTLTKDLRKECVKDSFGKIDYNVNKKKLREDASEYFGINIGVDFYAKTYSELI